MLTIAQLQTMHGQALEDCGALLGRIVDLSLPTPCEGWNLSALLGHMIGQNDGFAVAVRDGDADPGAFAPVGVVAVAVGVGVGGSSPILTRNTSSAPALVD